MLGIVDEDDILFDPCPAAPPPPAAAAAAALRTCILAKLSASPAIALRLSELRPLRSGPEAGRGRTTRGGATGPAEATGSETARGGGLGRFIADAGTGTDVFLAVLGGGRFDDGGGREPREEGYLDGRADAEDEVEAERDGTVGAALDDGTAARFGLERDESDEMDREDGREVFMVLVVGRLLVIVAVELTEAESEPDASGILDVD